MSMANFEQRSWSKNICCRRSNSSSSSQLLLSKVGILSHCLTEADTWASHMFKKFCFTLFFIESLILLYCSLLHSSDERGSGSCL